MKIDPIRVTLSIAGGALMGIATMSGWYALTPRMTVDAMASAAQRGDSANLVRHMDMTALRMDMRRRAQQALETSAPPGLVLLDPKAVTEALVGGRIDETFSLKGARKALRRKGAGRVPDHIDYRIMRNGPNAFVARLDGPRRVDLLFTRKGLTWMLTGIAARPRPMPQAMI